MAITLLNKTTTYIPDVYFQVDNVHVASRMTYRLFSLPNTFFYFNPYFDTHVKGPWYPDNSPESYAAAAADFTYNLFQQSKNLYPNKQFKYGLNISGYYHGSYNEDNIKDNSYDSLYNHELDAITINSVKYPSPWHKNGIVAKRNFMNRCFARLKTLLDARGLPYPAFIDADMEQPECFGYQYNAPLQVSWDLHHSDRRFLTELIDGRQTLYTYLANLKKLDGTSYPLTVYPWIYDVTNPNSGIIYGSLHKMIEEHILWQSFGIPAKTYFPNTLIHNWVNYSSSRTYKSFSHRIKEANVDHVLRYFDANVPSWYTIEGMEQIALENYDSPNYSYGSFRNFQEIYGIPSNLTISQKLQLIFSKQMDYHIFRIKANSTKPVVPWVQWQDFLSYDSSYISPSGGSCQITLVQMRQVLDVFKKHNVRYFGCFEPLLSATKAEQYYQLLNYSLSATSTTVIN